MVSGKAVAETLQAIGQASEEVSDHPFSSSAEKKNLSLVSAGKRAN